MTTISNTAVTTSGGKMNTTKSTKTGKTVKSLCAALALASLATTVMPADAEAGWRGRRNWAIGAGVVGGLAAGALIAGAANAHGYGYGGGYYAAPVYAGPECYWTRQRRVTWDGYVVVRRVRVCD
jgi:hypothetical protein